MISRLEGHMSCAAIWHLCYETALTESTPNQGKRSRLSIRDRRLLQNGHTDICTMRVGAVLVTQTHCIHIGKLTPLLSDDELWSHDPQRTRTTICTATPDKKGLLLWKLFPTHNPHTFLTLILSNSTLVVISWSHPSAPGENTISSSHVVTITPRASCSGPSKSEPRPSTNIHSKPVRPPLVSSPP